MLLDGVNDPRNACGSGPINAPISSRATSAHAEANATVGDGLGAAPYWFMAGPGRDPGYNGTVSEATSWGAAPP